MTVAELDSPDLFPELQPFWTALRDGRLLLKRCNACAEVHFYPRTRCPICGSGDTVWQESSGIGTIYSFALPRRGTPSVAPAVVELDGGLRIPTVIRDADLFDLHIGQRVVVHPQSQDGKMALSFTTAAADEARQYAARVSTAAVDVPGLTRLGSHPLERVAVIGAGTMGIGITMALVNAGVPAVLIDVDEQAAQRGVARICGLYDVAVQRSRITALQAQQRMDLITASGSYEAMHDCDAVIEAVWEQLALKQQVFEQIDAHARPGALLGTNTSGLDVNVIAQSTRRAADVVGLHFFTPAQSMKLLELVRGRDTSDTTISHAMALGVKLGKVPVLVESCPGFVGNRIFGKREDQARAMLLEGATPEQVDRVLVQFGMPMGTFELQDLTGGVELLYRRRQSEGRTDWLGDRMYEAGRRGQKSGKGYFLYAPGNRKPVVDPEFTVLLEEVSLAAGVVRRKLGDEEIRERLLLPMINEACKLIDEGVVIRPTDIDAVWLHGYGWPAWRGGLLHYADQLTAAHACERLLALERMHGPAFAPAPLLRRMAASGARFIDLPQRGQRAAAFCAK